MNRTLTGGNRIDRMMNVVYRVVVGIVLVSICGFPMASSLIAQDSGKSKSTLETEKEIKSILETQAKAWNDGSLERFMETYWKSDELTFSGGGKTTHGWQATLDNYRKGYAPPKEMGQLHFDHLKIMMIESRSALVLGNWHLRMKGNVHKDGNFSLVLKRFESGWKIIHDHSSTLEPDEKSDDPDKNE